MRVDMAKVIVERPRWGSDLASKKKGYRRSLQKLDVADLPRKEPLAGRWRGMQRALSETSGTDATLSAFAGRPAVEQSPPGSVRTCLVRQRRAKARADARLRFHRAARHACRRHTVWTAPLWGTTSSRSGPDVRLPEIRPAQSRPAGQTAHADSVRPRLAPATPLPRRHLVGTQAPQNPGRPRRTVGYLARASGGKSDPARRPLDIWRLALHHSQAPLSRGEARASSAKAAAFSAGSEPKIQNQKSKIKNQMASEQLALSLADLR